ncbi:MAG TPA: M28 family peptidase [Gammaproteobacteria bacterium]|nr:M28 family peptidase [Gammaproteobacteria bacterium]
MRRAGPFLILLIIASAATIFLFTQVVVIDMPGRSYQGALPPLSSAQSALAKRLESDVRFLAGDIGERNLFRHRSLERAAGQIAESLESSGHQVALQEFVVRGTTVRNVEGMIPGRDPEAGVVVVGAHYDSVQGSPGANDNASGVAALLEIGRALRGRAFKRGIRLVAFVNEEEPFSYTESMGSVRYARHVMEQGAHVVAMVSLETIGYYTDDSGTQRYPFPLSYFYPDIGNFVGFVGNPASKTLVRRMVSAFRENARFPSEGLAAPERIPGVGWSDHWAFWQQGLPAVMVTDTALYRYHEYHTSRDTPGILAYDRFARVVEGLIAVIVDLADGV